MSELHDIAASPQPLTRLQVRDAITQATGLDLDAGALEYLQPARPILVGAIRSGYHDGIRHVVERGIQQALAKAGCPYRINLHLLYLLTAQYGWQIVHAAVAGGTAHHPHMARLIAVLGHYQRTGELPDGNAPTATHQAQSAA